LIAARSAESFSLLENIFLDFLPQAAHPMVNAGNSLGDINNLSLITLNIEHAEQSCCEAGGALFRGQGQHFCDLPREGNEARGRVPRHDAPGG
jgi:hypothetical protein